MYASSRIHEALSSRTNQENEFSLNRFLGWLPVQHTRAPMLHHCASVRHTRDIQEDSNHDRPSHHHNEPDASNSNADDHHDEQYDRATLLSIRSNMGVVTCYQWIRSIYPDFPRLIDEKIKDRKLDQLCYSGRYLTTTNHSDHSTTSNDLRQELRSTTEVCKGCYEHVADLETIYMCVE